MSAGTYNGFQNVIYNQPGVGVLGDFADANIRATVLAGASAYLAAPAPRAPAIGQFAWFDQAGYACFGSYRGEATTKLGFIHRENQAIIVPFLAQLEMYLEAGLPVTGFDQGAFWAAVTSASGNASAGQKAYANYKDGSVYYAATGQSTVDGVVVGAIAVTTGILTVASVTSGALKVGDVLSGAGVPAGTAIVSQLSGAIGGVGTYQTTIITAVASATITATGSVETAFVVEGNAVAGDLVKISTWA